MGAIEAQKYTRDFDCLRNSPVDARLASAFKTPHRRCFAGMLAGYMCHFSHETPCGPLLEGVPRERASWPEGKHLALGAAEYGRAGRQGPKHLEV